MRASRECSNTEAAVWVLDIIFCAGLVGPGVGVDVVGVALDNVVLAMDGAAAERTTEVCAQVVKADDAGERERDIEGSADEEIKRGLDFM